MSIEKDLPYPYIDDWKSGNTNDRLAKNQRLMNKKLNRLLELLEELEKEGK